VESFLFPFPPVYYPTSSEVIIPKAQEYYDRMLQLLQVLHQISAEALGVSLEYFNSHYNPMESMKLQKEVTGFYLRFAYYPALGQSW
jgi:hypothetical protein